MDLWERVASVSGGGPLFCVGGDAGLGSGCELGRRACAR